MALFKRKIYLPEEEVISLYKAGDSFRYLETKYGVSAWTVRQVLVRNKVPSRKPVEFPRTMGPEHWAWKDKACYTSLHQRVWRRRGQEKRCAECGTTDPSKIYEWASLTGNYADVNDYKRMCRSCHMKYDYSIGVRIGRGRPRPPGTK